jgi:ABC-type multidrug transport system ATPase subunit/ABC-type multidrug transport system permease subunit
MDDDIELESYSHGDAIQIRLHQLGYHIDGKRDENPILSDISAVFRPGRLTVILGPSGSGKTTLLSLIAGLEIDQAKHTSFTGTITYNGEQIPTEKIKKIVGFVFQDDILMDTMTVKEAIAMSIKLRVNIVSKEQKNKLLNRILNLSRLEDAQDVFIGSPEKKGISGGERKRTAIALELVSNPSVLILDEPTSGLDSYTAFRIMVLLRRLAHKYGRTVIATLHQPSSEIFHLIDDLHVLHDGQLVYGGAAEDLVPYFTQLGYHFPPLSNPLDVLFMDILNPLKEDGDNGSDDDGVAKQASSNGNVPMEQLAEYYRSSEFYAKDVIDTPTMQGGVTRAMYKFRAGFPTAYGFLVTRNAKRLIRDMRISWIRLGQTLFLAGFIAIAFWNTKYAPAPALYQNISGALFFITTNAFFSSFQNILPIFSHEKRTFAREYCQGYYGLLSYFLAKISVELPFTLIFPLFTSVIVYWSLGFRSGVDRFLIFTVTTQLVSLSGFSYGLLTAALFNDLAMAQAISILFLLPMMIFAGLILNVATVPAVLRWLQWISPMRYGFTSLMTNQFKGWDEAYGYYIGLNAGNELSILINLVILFGLFLVGLLLSYFALVRLVFEKKIRQLIFRGFVHVPLRQ